MKVMPGRERRQGQRRAGHSRRYGAAIL